MALNRVIEATELPVTIKDARTHARLDPEVPDSEVEDLILTAAQMWESATQRVLTPSVWELTLDGFVANQEISLLTAPVISVEWIHYIKEDGSEVEVDPVDYYLDAASSPCFVAPARGKREWPTDAMNDINVVTIRFTAGYQAIDRDQRRWVLAMVGSLDRFREAHSTTPVQRNDMFDRLLDKYKLIGV